MTATNIVGLYRKHGFKGVRKNDYAVIELLKMIETWDCEEDETWQTVEEMIEDEALESSYY